MSEFFWTVKFDKDLLNILSVDDSTKLGYRCDSALETLTLTSVFAKVTFPYVLCFLMKNFTKHNHPITEMTYVLLHVQFKLNTS